MHAHGPFLASLHIAAFLSLALSASAQLTDVTQTPNTLGVGIQKSLIDEIGAGRGDMMTPGSSEFLINRDPFRAIMRGRQLFQRKFTRAQGVGPRKNDGIGNVEVDAAVAAGLADSCAACHGRPFGSAGFGGNVFTRPDSRDAPHLFGLGLKEMLGDEITQDLRAIRSQAIAQAAQTGQDALLPLASKGIHYGSIIAHPDGSLDTSLVQGVNADLRVRPFFWQGKAFSMRDFIVGALKAEMGLEAFDPDLVRASSGEDIVTPSGMHLSGSLDTIDAPPVASPTQDGDGDGVVNEIPTSLVDDLEFYLLNYFKPGTGRQTAETAAGFATFKAIGCADCHVPDLVIQHDRRVADVETVCDPSQANCAFNQMYATAETRYVAEDDGSGLPTLKRPSLSTFRVHNIFADFKRHDLGAAFHERNFDGTVTTQFMTAPLWGAGSTPPYGHDGRSPTLEDVILRHGGDALASRMQFQALSESDQRAIVAFLNTLVLFSPPDTASNLEHSNPSDPNFPLHGHGSINLSVLFNTPSEKE
jgi:cytochrome c553